MMTSSDIYGPSYGSLNYEPQNIEVYYLPTRDFNRINKLSDSDFDMERTNGVLVWSGVI
jgi:hypothetical protein